MANNLLLGARMKDIPALPEERLQIFRNVSSGDVDAPYAARHGEALVHGHGMRHAVAGIEHDARRPPARV